MAKKEKVDLNPLKKSRSDSGVETNWLMYGDIAFNIAEKPETEELWANLVTRNPGFNKLTVEDAIQLKKHIQKYIDYHASRL